MADSKKSNSFEKNKQNIIRVLERTGIILFILLAIFMIIAGVASLLGVGSGSVDLQDYVVMHYSGYEGKGSAELVFDRATLEDSLMLLYAKYESGLFPLHKGNDADDYIEFAHSFEPVLENSENLKNDDTVKIKFLYDEELSEKIHVTVENIEMSTTVQGLNEGVEISEEEVFGGLKFSVDGVSPALTVSITNESKDDFVKTIKYVVADEKACYENGDILKIQAVCDESIADASNIDLGTASFIKEFQIDGFEHYASSTSEISAETLKHAINVGKTYFGDATDYGLRIITEAGLYPDFSKGYEFDNPEILSAYLEVIEDPAMASAAKPYNYLELCYNVHLGQPGGKVGCMAEAIVSFSNITIDKDGNIRLDESTGKLFSASHNDSSIKKSLNEWFGSDYKVERFELPQEVTPNAN